MARQFNVLIEAYRGRDAWLKRYFPASAARRANARVKTARAERVLAAYHSASQRDTAPSRQYTPGNETSNLRGARLYQMQADSREAFRNNPLYLSIIRRAVDNIIGSGLEVRPRTGDSGLNAELKLAFAEYADGGGHDVAGQSLDQRERVLLISLFRDGDHLAYKSDAGRQYFEAPQIATPIPRRALEGQTFHQGVETDTLGKPIRYYVAAWNRNGYAKPGEVAGLIADRCQLFGDFQWTSGWRSPPPLQSSLPQFDDLAGYLEAELVGARAASCVMGSISSKDPGGIDIVSDVNDTSTAATTTRPQLAEFTPGKILNLDQDEKFEIHSADRPSGAFKEFTRLNQRILAAPIGLPLELAFMDFQETSFTGGRLLLNMAERGFAVWQKQPARLRRAVYLDYVAANPDGFKLDSVDHPTRHAIIGPRPPWVDPVKEATARAKGKTAGWESVAHVLEEMNREVSDVVAENLLLIETAMDAADRSQKSIDWRDLASMGPAPDPPPIEIEVEPAGK